MAQPPIRKLRIGNLSAAVWQNTDAQSNPFYTCTFARSYTDDEGNWHETQSFGRADLLKLAKLADQAHTCIEELVHDQREKTPGSEEGGSATSAITGVGKARARQRS